MFHLLYFDFWLIEKVKLSQSHPGNFSPSPVTSRESFATGWALSFNIFIGTALLICRSRCGNAISIPLAWKRSRTAKRTTSLTLATPFLGSSIHTRNWRLTVSTLNIIRCKANEQQCKDKVGSHVRKFGRFRHSFISLYQSVMNRGGSKDKYGIAELKIISLNRFLLLGK